MLSRLSIASCLCSLFVHHNGLVVAVQVQIVVVLVGHRTAVVLPDGHMPWRPEFQVHEAFELYLGEKLLLATVWKGWVSSSSLYSLLSSLPMMLMISSTHTCLILGYMSSCLTSSFRDFISLQSNIITNLTTNPRPPASQSASSNRSIPLPISPSGEAAPSSAGTRGWSSAALPGCCGSVPSRTPALRG